VVSLHTPTPDDDCSVGGGQFDGEKPTRSAGLTFGFPVQADGKGSWKVKSGFTLDEFAKEKIKITTEELLASVDDVAKLSLI